MAPAETEQEFQPRVGGRLTGYRTCLTNTLERKSVVAKTGSLGLAYLSERPCIKKKSGQILRNTTRDRPMTPMLTHAHKYT